MNNIINLYIKFKNVVFLLFFVISFVFDLNTACPLLFLLAILDFFLKKESSGKLGALTISGFLFLISCFLSFWLGKYDVLYSGFYQNILILFLFLYLYPESSLISDSRFMIAYTFCSILLLSIICFSVIQQYLTISNTFSDDLTNFKSLFNMFGISINNWSTIVVLTVPINVIFLQKEFKNFVFDFMIRLHSILIFVALILTFSRAVYYSSFIFLVIYFTFLLIKKEFNVLPFLKNNKYLLLAFISVIFYFKEPIITTLNFNKTISQKRSISGRINKLEIFTKNIQDYSFFGLGHNNYPLSESARQVNSNSEIFSVNTNNLLFTFLAEQGIVGLISIILLFLVMLIILCRNISKKMEVDNDNTIDKIILSAGIIYFLLKELTYSSLRSNSVILLSFLILVLFVKIHDTKIFLELKSPKLKASLRAFFFAFLLISISYNYFIHRNLNSYTSGDENYFSKTDFNDSKTYNYKIFKEKAFSFVNEMKIHKIALPIDVNELVFNGENNLPKAIEYLEKAKKTYDKDSEIYHNLSWLYYYSKDYKKSLNSILASLDIEPNNYLSKISLLLMFPHHENSVTDKLKNILKIYPEFITSEVFRSLKINKGEILNTIESELVKDKNFNSNPILKAKLGVLLSYSDFLRHKEKSKYLLLEVTNTLPNLNRPWLSLARLSLLDENYVFAKKYIRKSELLDRNDYLNFKIWYLYHYNKNNYNKACNYFDKYNEKLSKISSPFYKRNYFFYKQLKTKKNTSLPNNLVELSSNDPSIPVL